MCVEGVQVTWSKLYYEHIPRLLKNVSCDSNSSFLECNEECHEDIFYFIKQPELGFAANLQPPLMLTPATNTTNKVKTCRIEKF